VVRCAKDIEKMIRPMLERLLRKIFRKQTKMVMGPRATTHELVEIQDSNEENKKVVGAIRNFFESCDKSRSNHRKSINDGATTDGKTPTHDSIIISIRFGKFTSICTKTQNNGTIKDGSINSIGKGYYDPK
jgi:hypothetical protein